MFLLSQISFCFTSTSISTYSKCQIQQELDGEATLP